MEQIESRTVCRVSGCPVCSEKIVGYTFRDGQSRAPLITQDVETDGSVGVDVWVVDAGGEVDLWRLEWVVGWEVDCQEEDTAGVW